MFLRRQDSQFILHSTRLWKDEARADRRVAVCHVAEHDHLHGAPGRVVGKGPAFVSKYLAYLVVGYVLLPRYMTHKVHSAYELLEERLGVSVRLLGARGATRCPFSVSGPRRILRRHGKLWPSNLDWCSRGFDARLRRLCVARLLPSLDRTPAMFFLTSSLFSPAPVISGLVMSGLFAAAMSSLDSGVNSITAVVMRDFLDRFNLGPKTDVGHYRIARWMAFGVGSIGVIGSCFMKHAPGNFIAVTGKTVNFFTMPIFCLFVFALMFHFASPVGVWIGTFCGVVASALVAFSGPIFVINYDSATMNDPISFQWIHLAALWAAFSSPAERTQG